MRSLGAISGRRAFPRRARASPGRAERWGYEAISGRRAFPRRATASPGRAERWALWGHFGPPRIPETRHGFAGARRAVGGMGGHFGAPHLYSRAGPISEPPMSDAASKSVRLLTLTQPPRAYTTRTVRPAATTRVIKSDSRAARSVPSARAAAMASRNHAAP